MNARTTFLRMRKKDKDGKQIWRRQGLAGPDGLEVARNQQFIALKTPGFSYNISGIRGMPDIRYSPATIDVYRIVKVLEKGECLQCEDAIDFPASTPKAETRNQGTIS